MFEITLDCVFLLFFWSRKFIDRRREDLQAKQQCIRGRLWQSSFRYGASSGGSDWSTYRKRRRQRSTWNEGIIFISRKRVRPIAIVVELHYTSQ